VIIFLGGASKVLLFFHDFPSFFLFLRDFAVVFLLLSDPPLFFVLSQIPHCLFNHWRAAPPSFSAFTRLIFLVPAFPPASLPANLLETPPFFSPAAFFVTLDFDVCLPPTLRLHPWIAGGFFFFFFFVSCPLFFGRYALFPFWRTFVQPPTFKP